MKSVTLHAWSLTSKFGFCDGDLLDDWVYDRYEFGPPELPSEDHIDELGFQHRVLSAAVRKYLLPKCDPGVQIHDMSSHHNPTRVQSETEHLLRDEWVDVSYEQLDELATEVLRAST